MKSVREHLFLCIVECDKRGKHLSTPQHPATTQYHLPVHNSNYPLEWMSNIAVLPGGAVHGDEPALPGSHMVLRMESLYQLKPADLKRICVEMSKL